MPSQFVIIWIYIGKVKIGNISYTFNHDDPAMGTVELEKIFTDLGYDVFVEEWY